MNTIGYGPKTTSGEPIISGRPLGNRERVAGTDSDGNISGALYSTRDGTGNGNGDIDCNGSKTGVWYGMVTFTAGKGGPEIPIHALSGATLDITQVTPITTNRVSAAGTGDTTYVRLDGSNQPFTGNTSPTGNGTLNLAATNNRWNANLFNVNSTGLQLLANEQNNAGQST